MSQFNIPELIKDPYNYANKLPIPKLVKLLKELTNAYYTDNPTVTDNVYDILKDLLETKDPNNKFLKTVGYDISNNRSKVVLPYPAFSLDKKKVVPTKFKGPFVLSDKLDGLSLTLHKNHNVIKLYTRGNGIEGQDVSHLITYLFQNYNFSNLPNVCGIRAEIVITKKNFELVKGECLDHRSCIAGLVNCKSEALITDNFKAKLIKLVDFVCHELLEPRHKIHTQYEMLKTCGLKVVDNKTKPNITNEILSKYLTKRREKSPYFIDGIVVGDSSKVYELPKDGNPDYAFAFKLVFNDQIVETVVRHIEWNVSKDGYIKPIVVLEPVKIGGITVTNVTGNNARYIVTNKIGPGTVIKLIRSGDVIPKIIEIMSGQVDTPQLPTIKYKWNPSGADIIATEMSQETKIKSTIKKIAFFFKEMNIQFIGEGVVEKMVKGGYDSIDKILKADINDMVKINGLGKDLLTKIFNNIRVSFETSTLSTLMYASGVFGRAMGSTRIELILKEIPNVMDLIADESLKNKIIAIDGFSNITSNQFVDGLDTFRAFFKILQQNDKISVGQMLIQKKQAPVNNNAKFKDKKYVFTGKRNKPLEDYITNNGGTIGTSVNKLTTALLCENKDDTTSSKYVNAEKLGIPIFTYKEFETLNM